MAARRSLIALFFALASAPAWANDPSLTAQQTSIGEAATETNSAQTMASVHEGAAPVQESSAIENSDRMPPPKARLGGPKEPAAVAPIVPREPSGRIPPLILGIGH